MREERNRGGIERKKGGKCSLQVRPRSYSEGRPIVWFPLETGDPRKPIRVTCDAVKELPEDLCRAPTEERE